MWEGIHFLLAFLCQKVTFISFYKCTEEHVHKFKYLISSEDQGLFIYPVSVLFLYKTIMSQRFEYVTKPHFINSEMHSQFIKAMAL